MQLPRMAKARQLFDHPSVTDIPETIRAQLKTKNLAERIKPGQRIAVTAGSRGIANISLILKTVVEELKILGAEPFLVPAMGSHGGSTPEGQVEVLHSMGITEETVGALIVSSMEVKPIGTLHDGVEIYLSKVALEADGILPVSRIKPHTDFKGEIESGLLKMLAIGLGNQKGAEMIHWHRYDGYHRILPEAGKHIIEKTNVVMGLAVLENAYHKTASIHVIHPEKFYDQEKRLLEKAKQLLPRLPFNDIDVLVIEEIGKNISGVGMDTNVTGRFWMDNEDDPRAPKIKKIVVLDLTEETHGNAIGLGLADLTTRRAYEKIDYHQTYVNCLTQGSGETGKIPPFLPNDRDAIATAIRISGPIQPHEARVIRIKNTQELEELYISEALVTQLKKDSEHQKRLQLLEDPQETQFDVMG
ncbi:MAG: nickel-dependent lactate racemase, partial [Candidatus Bathyarchaeota archaeon]|nr:nickel-dependent lactate racemase [Candidatus Bathyarchaeota archaeon]